MATATVGRGRARGLAAAKASPDALGLSRPPLESTRPPLESTRFPLPSTRPPLEATRPPLEATRPPLEATRPPQDSIPTVERPAAEVAGGLVQTRPPVIEDEPVSGARGGFDSIPETISILMLKQAGYEQEFCDTVRSTIMSEPQINEWLASCVTHLYGKRTTTKLFVSMIRRLCANLVPNENTSLALDVKLQQALRKCVLIKLQADFTRVSSPGNGGEVNEKDLCQFTEILATVYLSLPLPNGSLIHQLADPLWQCLNLLSKPGSPIEMFSTVHYVCMLAGYEIERSLTALNVTDKLEDLYNQFRSVIIDDVTEDTVRLMMLEIIELRAYDYKMPERCVSYYQNEREVRGM